MTTLLVPEPAREVQDFLSQTHKLLIGGKRVDAANGETFKVQDPSTNLVISHVPKGGKEDIDRAVKAARNAFENKPWGKLTVSERGKLIWKLADLIEERTEEFAQLETLDNGKPLAINNLPKQVILECVIYLHTIDLPYTKLAIGYNKVIDLW